MTALDDLTALLVSLPNATLLTDQMKLDALAGSLIPDTAQVWPGNSGYVTTYDTYFAAISLIGFLRAQPVVRQSSSEGTSVSVDAPNWAGLISWYRAMSPISQATGSGVLNKVQIPDGPHVYHKNMSFGGGGRYDDVDTDLS
jgi:hypothetical protein